jgi:LysM repeat protein
VRLAVAIIVATAATAHAQPPEGIQNYRVKQGDTLELVAAEFYGDRNHAIFIMAENKMTHPRPLRPGERLRIPVTRDITTAPADTWETLAATYLGNPRRGTFLADFNHLSADDSLPAGSPLVIPFHVTHQAQGTETLASIAAAYTGDAKNAELIRRYNFLDKDAIEKGESVLIPIHNVPVKAAKLPPIDAESRGRREHQRAAAVKVATALPAAYAAWHNADYKQVEDLLVGIEQDDREFLSVQAAVDVGVLLGCAYVAFDDQALAIAAFKHVLERKKGLQLDPYKYSPKVLDVWQKARRDQP